MEVTLKNNKPITHIVVHHSASRPDTTPAEIEEWHRARGFKGIGYHKIITEDGEIHSTRPEDIVPASVKGKNKGTLTVCLTGNFEEEEPKPFQLVALQIQIRKWKEDHPAAKVVAHKDLAPTLCCGSYLYSWLKENYPDNE
jgi:N-acetylmuramoyl-L-alanine amidase